MNRVSVNHLIMKCQYLVVDGEGGHLHGHRHDVHSAVDQAGLKLLVKVHKLLRPGEVIEQVYFTLLHIGVIAETVCACMRVTECE